MKESNILPCFYTSAGTAALIFAIMHVWKALIITGVITAVITVIAVIVFAIYTYYQ